MEQKDYRLAAIMFTDIAGFSRMMEKDEAGTLELLHFHNKLIADIVKSHNGTVIKTIGDAFLVDFKNTVEALKSALEIQQKLYEYNKGKPEKLLLLRIGVHLGDITFYENDAFGEGINIASRLQSIAKPGGICISGDVYNLVLNKLDFHAERLGKVSLKNISKEIHAYEIATPNVEFDPNPQKPRILHPDPAFEKEAGDMEFIAAENGSVKEGEAPRRTEYTNEGEVPSRAAPPREAPAPSAKREQIKKEIMADLKAAGRRLEAPEVWRRYQSLGEDARAVIDELVAKGLLVRGPDRASPSGDSAPRSGPNPDWSAPGSGPRPASAERSGLADLSGILPAGIYDKLLRMEQRIEEGVSRAIDRRGGMPRPPMNPMNPMSPMGSRFEVRLDRGDRADRADRIDRGENRASRRGYSPMDEYEEWSIYKQKAIRAGKGAKGGLIGHAIPFVAVNGLLFFIWFSTGAGFPWYLFPFFGWGIGLINHFVSAKLSSDEAKEVERLPDLDRKQLRIWKKLQGLKRGVLQHLASFVSISALLFVINVVTAGSFFWAAIPAVALGFSFLMNVLGSGGKSAALKKELLSSFGISGSWRELFRMGGRKGESVPVVPPGHCRDAVNEAMSIKSAIIEQLRGSRSKDSPLGKDMIPALDSYMKQVYLLAARTAEVEAIIETIPMQDLEKDKAVLVAKRDSASADSLKREYQKSIDEIERHGKSFGELKEQKEVLDLRLRSSVNNLKQMQLDVARSAAMSTGAGEGSTIKMMQEKTDELSRYLEAVKSQPIDEFEEFDRRLADGGKAAGLPEGKSAAGGEAAPGAAAKEGLALPGAEE